MEPTEQDTPCSPLDRQAIAASAWHRMAELEQLIGELRNAEPLKTPGFCRLLMKAAAEALEQVAS